MTIVPWLACQQMRDGRTAHEERTVKGDAHHLAPVGKGKRLDRCLAADGGIVDENIEATECLDRLADQPRGILLLRHVAEQHGRRAAFRLHFARHRLAPPPDPTGR